MWKKGNEEEINKARKLYRTGLSTRAVGDIVGRDCSTIFQWCKDLTKGRRHPFWGKSKHWRSARARSRRIMERHLGRKLIPSEIVHHRDGDYTNTELKNLEVMTRAEHVRHHFRIDDPNHVPRWAQNRGPKYWQWWIARGRALKAARRKACTK